MVSKAASRPGDASAQPPPPRDGLKGRAYHTKSRAGCFSCKKRHVRCNEGQPACSSCQRLLLRCEYPQGPRRPARNAASAKQQAMQHVLLPVEQSEEENASSCHAPPRVGKALVVLAAARSTRMPRHLWTVDDTARAIVHAGFATFDPAGLTRSRLFAYIVPRESLHKDCYRYVCLAIRDLSRSPNTAVRARGFHALGQTEHFLPLQPGGKDDGNSNISRNKSRHGSAGAGTDKHLVAAVGNYARALAAFRDALPSMAPPDIAYATVCFAVLELLQGHVTSRNVIMLAGVALLRPYVVAPRETRPDGAVRYGLHPRYADSRELCDTEAVIVRYAAAGVLGGLTVPLPGVESTSSPPDEPRSHGRKRPSLPTLHLPDTLPAPPELPHDDVDVDDGGLTSSMDMDTLRRQWDAFHGTLESWLLSRYWAIATGYTLDA
ncbi:uncharacterized protein B0I36DRAFT_366613 [Microdochium trichocladiopsis]|uniref:Zn(2)-C6 fungal-type domain-containing protein n=1 Tax=Microdochium trichocladiopsis TaxID=1682393 RepID=A0A9P8XZV3_9PEZI|nr:uncharacterized protein B0I36DRAFT_366613 [Microdochium trichocladiopsis]KAH7024688.1 hypothetical protein B0I36DRAFT_366613 [Microdochium trichocladiopsis]